MKENVARKKTVRAIQIQRSGRIASSMTKNTAAICEKVFALPKMLGRKSRKPAIANSTALAASIEISRLNTRTVNFHGILCRMESTGNIVLSKSLSAMGSRYCPSRVCWCSLRASSPSRPSLNPAITNKSKAQKYRPSTNSITMKGTKAIRSIVSWLGAVKTCDSFMLCLS